MGPYWIWLACAVTRTMVISRPELLLRDMSGSMVLQQLGFVMCPCFMLPQGFIGTMCFEIQGLY